MPPNQQQPVPPVQQQPDPNLNFVPDVSSQPQPPVQQQPVVPQVDPTITQLQSDIAEIKTALTTQQPAPVQQPEPTAEPVKKYDEWGAVFEDVDKRAEAIVEKKLAQREEQNQKTNQQVTEQEKANQQYIDSTVGQLRSAGYLPPVANQFDENDPGRQAENELLGYAVYGLGSTDLVKAAQELKFRHDAGFKFDSNTKQFVQVNQPTPGDPNAAMFGNIPQNPDQPFAQPVAAQPMPYQQPVGPQNPYMPRQYPPGFNAPVSSGGSFMGTQSGAPSQRILRGSSYDQLVENFNRTQ